MGLFGGGSQQDNRLSGIQFQQHGYGGARTIAYGTNRVTPVLAWTAGFRAVKQKAGGKGFGGGSGKSYKYFADVLFLVCEGPIKAWGQAWRDKSKFATTIPDPFTKNRLGDYVGQAVLPYLDVVYPTQALAYRGTALVADDAYRLTDGASLGNHSIEVSGRQLSSTPGAQNLIDAHVKDVILDFITNENYGAIDPTRYEFTFDFDQMHNYCVARGLLISPVLSEKKAAHEWIKEWLLVANSAVIWSEGVLKFKCFSDQAFSNSFGSYTPDTVIRYVFNDDNMDQLIKPERKNPADCHNKMILECLNRNKEYNKHPITVRDESSIRLEGLREADKVTIESICLPSIGIIVALTELSKNLNIRNTYAISTDWNADLLEPMDYVYVNDAYLGLVNTRCRIISIEDDELKGQEGGTIRITVEEAPLGVYSG